MITRQDLAITLGTSRWGAPMATVTVAGTDAWGSDYRRSYELRSTNGLVPPTRRDKPMIHVHEGGLPNGRWLGVFRTNDIDTAIDQLVEHLNELAHRERVSLAVESASIALRDALDRFGEALEASSHLDYRTEWQTVRDAAAAVDAVLAEYESGLVSDPENTQEPCDTCSGYGCAECEPEPEQGSTR